MRKNNGPVSIVVYTAVELENRDALKRLKVLMCLSFAI